MTDGNEPRRGFDESSNEELVARFKEQVARGILPFGLQRQVQVRGIECLASDPEMRTAVERLMEASAHNWANIKFDVIDPELLRTLRSPILEPTQKILDELSRKMAGQWDGAGLDVDPIGIGARHSSFFDDTTLEALTANSPRALHEELVQTLELGFGSIQEELAIQRETLYEQRDTQNHMKGSLQTLKENSPTKRTGIILLVAAIIAAVTGIASVAIALIVALNQTTHNSPQPAESASPSISASGQPSPTNQKAVR